MITSIDMAARRKRRPPYDLAPALLTAAGDLRRLHAFRDGVFVQQALQVAMAGGASAAGAAGLADGSDGDKVILLDGIANGFFRNVQAMAQRPDSASMSVGDGY